VIYGFWNDFWAEGDGVAEAVDALNEVVEGSSRVDLVEVIRANLAIARTVADDAVSRGENPVGNGNVGFLASGVAGNAMEQRGKKVLLR
jgi:hypothetical protein